MKKLKIINAVCIALILWGALSIVIVGMKIPFPRALNLLEIVWNIMK